MRDNSSKNVLNFLKAVRQTGAETVEAAIAWVFENREQGDILDAGAAGEFQEYKMVFVINSSLSMTPGKMAAQVGHGAIALYQDLVARQDIYGGALLQWSECGYGKSTKIDDRFIGWK